MHYRRKSRRTELLYIFCKEAEELLVPWRATMLVRRRLTSAGLICARETASRFSPALAFWNLRSLLMAKRACTSHSVMIIARIFGQASGAAAFRRGSLLPEKKTSLF